jgi:hypothetical protein
MLSTLMTLDMRVWRFSRRQTCLIRANSFNLLATSYLERAPRHLSPNRTGLRRNNHLERVDYLCEFSNHPLGEVPRSFPCRFRETR